MLVSRLCAARFSARRAVLIAVALAVAAAGINATVLPVKRANALTSAVHLSGVYRSGGPSGATGFGTWRGRAPQAALSFLGGSWSQIEVPSTWVSTWAPSTYKNKMVVSIHMLPTNDSTATVANGATGAYDAHWRLAAQHLVAAGMGDAIIRTGWEFNGTWFKWNAVQNPTQWVSYYKHIVDVMRSVAGQSFKFDWCPSYALSWNPAQAYPGDSYVDYIGYDVYDAKYNDPTISAANRWNWLLTTANGLNWLSTFATTHNKPITLPEWGLWTPGTIKGGGGDNPYYIQHMHDWIDSHNVAYETYFEKDATDGQHDMQAGHFPNAAALYIKLFGAAATSTPSPTPTATSTPSPSPTATSTPSPTPTATPGTVPAHISSVSAKLITAGQALTVNATGTPGQVVDLLDKMAPSTTYNIIRTSTLPSSGAVSWTGLKPMTNSVMQVRQRNTGSLSSTVGVQVRSAISRAARRTSVRHWTFYGTVTPHRIGQLATVYQVNSNGTLTTIGAARANSYGQYSLPHVFATNGTRTFVARTAADSVNAAGQSYRVTYAIN